MPPGQIPTPYTLIFQSNATTGRPPRYLLRLINTSFQTTFVFSIDNHMLTVVEADFVPIQGYNTTHLHIGIGQRYQVIVEALPQAYGTGSHQRAPGYGDPDNTDFWIRTYIVDGCTDGQSPGNDYYDRTGILRYDATSTATPSSLPWPDIKQPLPCVDEPLASLVPVVPWQVAPPSNNNGQGEDEGVKFDPNAADRPVGFPLARFALNPTSMQSWTPLRVNYSDPTFLDLNNTGLWPVNAMVIPEAKFTSEDWVCYLHILVPTSCLEADVRIAGVL